MIVHLLDGTYELFRQFYGLRRQKKGEDPPLVDFVVFRIEQSIQLVRRRPTA